VKLLPDQYCLAEHADSWFMRAHAAVAWAGRGAALSGLAALAARRYAPIEVEVIDVVVPKGGHRTGPDWIRVRSLSIPFATTLFAPAMPVAEPELALALAYGTVPAAARASYVHGAVKRGIVSPARLAAVLGSLPRVKYRGELAQRMNRIVAGAESYLEERAMADVLSGPGFEDLVFQHSLRVNGARYRVDALHLPTLTAFEFDGRDHAKPQRRQYDVARDAALATIGIQTVRYTFDDVTKRAKECRDNALAIIAVRSNTT